jgi:hypothetical protein
VPGEEWKNFSQTSQKILSTTCKVLQRLKSENQVARNRCLDSEYLINVPNQSLHTCFYALFSSPILLVLQHCNRKILLCRTEGGNKLRICERLSIFRQDDTRLQMSCLLAHFSYLSLDISGSIQEAFSGFLTNFRENFTNGLRAKVRFNSNLEATGKTL